MVVWESTSTTSKDVVEVGLDIGVAVSDHLALQAEEVHHPADERDGSDEDAVSEVQRVSALAPVVHEEDVEERSDVKKDKGNLEGYWNTWFTMWVVTHI